MGLLQDHRALLVGGAVPVEKKQAGGWESIRSVSTIDRDVVGGARNGFQSEPAGSRPPRVIILAHVDERIQGPSRINCEEGVEAAPQRVPNEGAGGRGGPAIPERATAG